MTDSDAEAFCREAGVVRVATLRELCLAGKAFAFHRNGFGNRVLLLSNSGGPGVLAADRAVQAGLALVDLDPVLVRRLRDELPAEAAVANPMDLLADAREDRFGPVLQAALDRMSDRLDAILMIHVVPFMVDAGPVVEALSAVASGSHVPLMHSMMGTLEHREAWFARLEAAGVPAFADSEEMCAAAGMLVRYHGWRARLDA